MFYVFSARFGCGRVLERSLSPQRLRFSIVFAYRVNASTAHIDVRPLLAIKFVAPHKLPHIAFQCPWRSAFEWLVDMPHRACIMLLQT